MALLSTPNEEDAVDIWIMKWSGSPVVDITTKYHCDPRRLYEIFHGEEHIGSRQTAYEELLLKDNDLAKIVATGALDPKRRKALGNRLPRQPSFFD